MDDKSKKSKQERKRSSSEKTERLTTFQEILKLGKSITQELQGGVERDITARWISFRIAELMKAVELAPPGTASELQGECTDLILKVWSLRRQWPTADPFASARALLKGLATRVERHNQDEAHETEVFLHLRNQLGQIADKEAELCYDAELARFDLETEQHYLETHRKHLSPDEIDAIEWLLKHRESLERTKKYGAGGEVTLVGDSQAARAANVVSALRRLSDQRRAAIDEFAENRVISDGVT